MMYKKKKKQKMFCVLRNYYFYQFKVILVEFTTLYH
jgi:hypothetical protein